MFRSLFRIVFILVIAAVLVFFFAPRFFNNAANSLISSASSSVHAQGLAQYIPPGVNPLSKTGALQVKLNNLLSNAGYDVTIDQGQCGNVWKDLGSIKSDGSGSFDNQIPLSTLDLNKTWYIDIHNQNASGTSVACGKLETNQASGNQAVNATHSVQKTGGQLPLSNQGNTPGLSPNLPNTGANPGSNQEYDNNRYPRKY